MLVWIVKSGLKQGINSLEIARFSNLAKPKDSFEEWRDFFEIIVGQTAIAIENSQLIEELQDELEERVAVHTADLFYLNVELEQATAQRMNYLPT